MRMVLQKGAAIVGFGLLCMSSVRAADVPPAVQAVKEATAAELQPLADDLAIFEVICPRWKRLDNTRVDVLRRLSVLHRRGFVSSEEGWIRVTRSNHKWIAEDRYTVRNYHRLSFQEEALQRQLLEEMKKTDSAELTAGVLRSANRARDDRFRDVALASLKDDTDWMLVSCAVKYLGAMHEKTAVPALLDLLAKYFDLAKDERSQGRGSYFIGNAVLDALGHIGDARAVSPLKELAKSRDDEVAARAGIALARMGHHDALETVRNSALNRNAPVGSLRRDCIKALAEHAGPQNAALFEALLEDDDYFVRIYAAESLLDLDPERSGATCLGLLRDPNHVVRQRVAAKYAEKGLKIAVPILKDQLGKNSPPDRETAEMLDIVGPALLEQLAKTSGQKGVSKKDAKDAYEKVLAPMMQQHIQEKHMKEIVLALLALGDDSEAHRLPSLVASEAGDDPKLARALDGLGDRAVPLVQVMFAADDWTIRYKVARVLVAAKNPLFAEILSEHMQEETDPDVRSLIERSLHTQQKKRQ